MKSCHKKVMQ